MAKELTRRELLQKAVPVRALLSPPGLVLDAMRCTGCGLCARDCPNEAVTISDGPRLELWFAADRCDACGVCVESCPEKCLRLVTGSRDAPPALLFETEMLCCEHCGEEIGPRAMIERIRLRVGRDRAGLLLCPSCKGAVRG